MFRKTSTIMFLLAVLFAPVSGAVGPAKAASCTAEQGQKYIDEGRYEHAIREFTCVIKFDPTGYEGYRGRIEAELLLGQFSNAVRDYVRLAAVVLPVDPDAESSILASYADRLAAAPQDIPALTGASFARWWLFDYPGAIQVINQLLEIRPDDLYANLFEGSSRVLLGANQAQGMASLDRALALAPNSPDVRYIVADAYLYGRSDYARAFAEAMLALQWGLDTPRVHAIIASGYLASGDLAAGASHIQRHIQLVTTELVTASPLATGGSLKLALVPGRTYSIPVPAAAGKSISIRTYSNDFSDTIMVLLSPSGTPVTGSDDFRSYYAGFDWTAEETGTYTLLATSFESVAIGDLVVTHR